MDAPRKHFRPKAEGYHERLDTIEKTLEKLFEDLEIMKNQKNYLKLQVSTSSLEGGFDGNSLSIGLASLLQFEKRNLIQCSVNKASSSSPSSKLSNAKSQNDHFHQRYRNNVVLENENLRISSRDLSVKNMPPMAQCYGSVLRQKEGALKGEQLCSIGHDLFAMQDWKGAMDMYSRCIPMLMQEVESKNKEEEEEEEERHKPEDLLLWAFSNRAETYLQLGNFEDALTDATHALKLNAKHGSSLVRKGKALDGLEQYEQSLACYMSVLREEPKDEHARKRLMQSKVSYEQAYKGIFDLTKFILSGSEGDLPSCCDFVGPLDIRRSPLGGRGLFATRDLAIGELVLVSSALLVAPKESMEMELLSLVSSSKRRKQQVFSLSSKLSKDAEEDLEVPLIDLFTPRSYHDFKQTSCYAGSQFTLPIEVFHEDYETIDEEANLKHIAQILEVNAINVMDVIECAEPRNELDTSNSINYSGLWLLPSFINHSCTPNCVTSTPAGIAFVRVSRQVKCGEELSIAYFDVMKSLEVRSKMSQQCHFACKCPRCAWERSSPKELQTAREKLLILANKAILDCMKCASPISRLRVLPHLASLILSFETILQSADLELDHQNWVRASIMDTYLAGSRVLMSARMYVEPTNRIQMLNLLVEAIKEGGGGDGEVMGIGVMLLNQVEWHHGKESKEYVKTESMLRTVFKIFHGNLPRDVFLELVFSYSKCLDSMDHDDIIGGMGDLYEALERLQETLTRSIAEFHRLQCDANKSPNEDIISDRNHSGNDNSISEFLSKIDYVSSCR